jgi:hypothetical protein
MTAVTQTMAVSAAQNAASSVAAGTSAAGAAGASGGIAGAVVGVTVGMVATAVVVGTVVAVTGGGGENSCPANVANYDIHLGRLDIYFQTPLKPLTQNEGDELTEMVIDRYNDLYGCESEFSRLMLDTTTIRCASQDECCKLVIDAKSGTRLLCEFETVSHCNSCSDSEPLFADPDTSPEQVGDTLLVGDWRSGVACFNFDEALDRSPLSSQACVDVAAPPAPPPPPPPPVPETFAPTATPTTAYPTFTPTTAYPTIAPVAAIVFAGNLVAPSLN